jgi:tRNA G18 (ribose-2'-O)-methylase SpoU
MGSVFARPPATAELGGLDGFKLGLDPEAGIDLRDVEFEPPAVICLGAEREGLGAVPGLHATARVPMRPGGPESLNVAAAAAMALYEVTNRMARRG